MLERIKRMFKMKETNRRCIDLAHVNGTWVFIERQNGVITGVSMAYSECADADENFAHFGEQFTAVP